MFCQIVVVFVVFIVGCLLIVVFVVDLLLKVIGVYYFGGFVECYLVVFILVDMLIYLFYVFVCIEDGCCVVDVQVDGYFKVLVMFK